MKIKDFYLKYRLIINCTILSCLFFANCFWQPMMYIIYPILAILLLVDNLNNGFSYIMFTIPFCVVGGDIGLGIFFGTIALFLIKYYALSIFRDKIKINKNVAILFGVFLLYCLLPIGKYNYNFWYKLAILSFIIFTVWVMVNQRKVINFRFNVRILCLSLIISCLFSAVYWISPHLQNTMCMIYIGENLVRYQALLGHPNAVGTICSLSISFMAYSFMKEKKWYDLALMFVMAFIGIFSFSKTYLIILILVGITIMIYLYRYDWRLALGITIAMLVAIGLFVLVFPEIYKIFYDRFLGTLKNCTNFSDIMNMITTDRWNLWLEYLTYLAAHPVNAIFGSGLGAGAIDKLSAHNAYISMIYQLGLVGSALFILIIVLIVRDRLKLKQKKIHKGIWLPLTVIALIFLIEDIMFYII